MNCFIGSFFTPKIIVNKVKLDSVDKNRSPFHGEKPLMKE